MNVVAWIARSKPVEIVLTLVVYTVYAAVIAVSVAPSLWLTVTTLPPLLAPLAGGAIPPLSGPAAWAVLTAAMVSAGAFYLFIVWGAMVQALLIRVMSLGIRPGRYPAVSLTTVRWLIYSGIYSLSLRMILPYIAMTFVINTYFRIIGCHIGRNVKLNTWMLNDAYLLTIDDDVVVGGNTDISCHLFENDHLTLMPITIGRGTLIGAHSYISPGVTIGNHCVVGLYSYLRTGRVIPDGAVITSLAGIDVRTARELERGRLPRYVREWAEARRVSG